MSKSPRGGQRTQSIRERLTVDRKQRLCAGTAMCDLWSIPCESHGRSRSPDPSMATRERRRMIRATRELRRGRGTVADRFTVRVL